VDFAALHDSTRLFIQGRGPMRHTTDEAGLLWFSLKCIFQLLIAIPVLLLAAALRTLDGHWADCLEDLWLHL